MHHVGLIEAMMVDRAFAVAHVDVGGLRQRREHLVRGMRGEDRGAVVRRRVAAHREVVTVHRVEARVAVPGLVEVNPVAGFLEQRLARARRCSKGRRKCCW